MADVGGYDLEFLEEPSNDYECPICHLVMRDPQIVDCCGYKYCSTCVERILTASKPCPMCQVTTFKLMPEKQLQRRISDLKVFCVEKKHGCQWTGEIRQLENHLAKVCPYAMIPCSLGCGTTHQRCSLQQHEEDDCPKGTPEIKLRSHMRKLETRLVTMETKCDQQEEKIVSLTHELQQLRAEKVEQDAKIAEFEKLLKNTSSSRESQQAMSLRAIEGELIRRCISFPVRVTTKSDTTWISPPFYSHPKGYVLQLTARLQKFSSAIDSLAYSFFSSGRNPDKGPVILSLNVLPQQEDEGNLDWPVHVSVDLLVITCSGDESKLYTLTKYKESKQYEEIRHMFTHRGHGAGRFSLQSDSSNDEDIEAGTVIGHARFCFSCRLLVLNIRYGPDPPPIEQDVRTAVDDGKH